MVKLTITENEADQRLDRFLRKYLVRASLGSIYKMIRKDVKLNGKRAAEDTMLRSGDELSLYISDEKLEALTREQKKHSARKQFVPVYEDEHVLIVNKPRGLLVHGDLHEKKNTLTNQVCGYLQDKGEYDPSSERTFAPSPVNRLDRNTTGLVIFGKDAGTLRTLTGLIRQRSAIEKYYMTIVCGSLESPLTLTDRISRDREKNISRIAEELDGREAVTYAEPLITGDEFSLVEVRILTGRTHQIRVHMAGAGFPLAGDAKYGNRAANGQLKKLGITTQLLHACRLEFSDMEELGELRGRTVEAPLPDMFKKAEKLLITGRKR